MKANKYYSIKMKKIAYAFIVFISLSSFVVFNTYKSSGGHPSSTGAPGEKTCADAIVACHSNATVTTDNINEVNTLVFSQADSTYQPGQTYTITLSAFKTGIKRFGFEIVALTNSDNKNSGTWIITDADRTHTLTGSSSLPDRQYITHSTNGTPAVSSGLGKWSFKWTAPNKNVGNITFYYATNCTNSSGDASGDKLYLSSFTIRPSATASIVAIDKKSTFKVQYEAANRKMFIQYNLIKSASAVLSMVDMQGKVVQVLSLPTSNAGKVSQSIQLPSNISNGMYVVNIKIGMETLTERILIQ
jgi:hypothetical protein